MDKLYSLFQTGQTPSELEVRGQLLQLADLLSWDAKCNRVLHDLVVSCYGAPGEFVQRSAFIFPSSTRCVSGYCLDYLANKAKEGSRSVGGRSGGRFQFNRNFPHNLETPPRHAFKARKLRLLKSTAAEVDERNRNQSERETMSGVDSGITFQPNLEEM